MFGALGEATLGCGSVDPTLDCEQGSDPLKRLARDR